jgi:hypothetical protein
MPSMKPFPHDKITDGMIDLIFAETTSYYQDLPARFIKKILESDIEIPQKIFDIIKRKPDTICHILYNVAFGYFREDDWSKEHNERVLGDKYINLLKNMFIDRIDYYTVLGADNMEYHYEYNGVDEERDREIISEYRAYEQHGLALYIFATKAGLSPNKSIIDDLERQSISDVDHVADIIQNLIDYDRLKWSDIPEELRIPNIRHRISTKYSDEVEPIEPKLGDKDYIEDKY